jgi:hypothetical protein
MHSNLSELLFVDTVIQSFPPLDVKITLPFSPATHPVCEFKKLRQKKCEFVPVLSDVH